MKVDGIIFSNIHDHNISELTRIRTLASVPFGCRYRLIDFPLSNMVNSNITNVNIITHYNYHSLMDHIGTGKDWDLARRSGGVKILPPLHHGLRKPHQYALQHQTRSAQERKLFDLSDDIRLRRDVRL
jgi:glucose-1-phosphate adenylyltransferase